MPCINDSSDRIHEVYKDRDTKEAMLCGLMSMLDGLVNSHNDAYYTSAERGYETPGSVIYIDYFLDKIDFKKAGFKKKELIEWWDEHKRKDIAKRKEEMKEQKNSEARAAALEKLTPDERKLLGLKEKS